jgi:hypothetical protein
MRLRGTLGCDRVSQPACLLLPTTCLASRARPPVTTKYFNFCFDAYMHRLLVENLPISTPRPPLYRSPSCDNPPHTQHPQQTRLFFAAETNFSVFFLSLRFGRGFELQPSPEWLVPVPFSTFISGVELLSRGDLGGNGVEVRPYQV